MTKLRWILASAALCVATIGGAALAKGHGDPAKHAARKAAMMQKFDADRDGVLSPAERAAMHDARASARFAKLDANGDGKLTLEEFKAGRAFGRGRHGGGHGGGALRKP